MGQEMNPFISIPYFVRAKKEKLREVEWFIKVTQLAAARNSREYSDSGSQVSIPSSAPITEYPIKWLETNDYSLLSLTLPY